MPVVLRQPRAVSGRSFFARLRLLIGYRELLFLWTGRELRSRYRQSVLGFGWALIQPVFQAIVLTVIFGNILHVPDEGFPYPVFVYTALLPWMLFSGSVSAAIPAVTGNMSLITKIYFPREILPLSSILARLVDFAISSLVFVALMIWYRVTIHYTIVYLPLLLLIQTLLAIGMSLLGAAVSVFLRDISFAVPLGMQLWMYASPVIYPLSIVPERWRNLYLINPMAGIIDSYRRIVLFGQPPNMTYLGISAALAAGICFISYQYFKKLEQTMSDVI